MAGRADAVAVLFAEGFIMLKVLQHFLIGASYCACMFFMLVLAITEPLS